MGTKIEWSDESWNPVTGCTKISAGCANCYAETMCKRFWKPWGYEAPPNHFEVRLHQDRLRQPLRWRKPRRVFVCSMGDLFHEEVPDPFINKVLTTCVASGIQRGHTFLILTKRAERMYEFFTKEIYTDLRYPRKFIWLGVSVENQKAADKRIPWLLKTPAAVRFVSYEPALEKVDFKHIHVDGQLLGYDCLIGKWTYPCMVDPLNNNKIDWVICGAESGPKARPFDMDWARSVKDQCQMAGIAFFLKQAPIDGKIISMPPLDGKVWDQYPEVSNG